MRLTVLSVSYPLARVSGKTAGGAEQVLSILDQALVRSGHHSIVLAPTGSKCYGLLIPVAVPAGVLGENAKREARRMFRDKLQWTLDHYQVDLLHMHGLDFCDYLPESSIPIVVTLHLPLDWYSPFAILNSRRNVTHVCVSNSQAGRALPRLRIDRVIHNGIDMRRFRPAPSRGDYAVAIGRICPEKGLHLAIDAAHKARVPMIIAGTVFDYPEHRQYFESMIAPQLNGTVRFIGPVGGDRKAQLLGGARCLLITSLVAETSSLVAMEAMASGSPVVAWRSGALPEIVDEGRTGFLVNSVDEMVEAITRAESIDPRACRAEAECRFSSEKMVAEYFDLYRSVTLEDEVPELLAA
jgi:glycosyltransferase involved in cell wall biosynthesis